MDGEILFVISRNVVKTHHKYSLYLSRYHRCQADPAGHLLAHKLLTEKVRSDEVFIHLSILFIYLSFLPSFHCYFSFFLSPDNHNSSLWRRWFAPNCFWDNLMQKISSSSKSIQVKNPGHQINMQHEYHKRIVPLFFLFIN